MEELSVNSRSKYVRDMFASLAGHYDRANRWMTWGQDLKWRREVIDRAQLPKGGKLLDIGTGTGDLAIEAIHREETLLVVGADFTPEMMRIGRKREEAESICWVNNDALVLPYCSDTFDTVMSGYLLRNVSELQASLEEQYRVLKAGGKMVCLDTTPPPADIWHLPVRLYLRFVIPIIGGWAAGDKEAYRYLPESTSRFLTASELAECIRIAGFREVGFRCFMGGSMAIHWGVK